MAGTRAKRPTAGQRRQRRSGAKAGGANEPRPPASQSWQRLTAAIADAIAVLGEEHCLVLSGKRRTCIVQLLSLGEAGLHAEAASNEWLRPDEALDRRAEAFLRSLGWQAPTLSRGQAEAAEEAEDAPSGCTNYFRDWAAAAPLTQVADLVTTTLREVYGIRRPNQLQYVAFAPGPREILLPTLGLDAFPLFDDHDEEDADEPAVISPESPAELQRAVIDALRSFTELEEVEVDEDGDVPLRHGSALLSLRVSGDAPFVEITSPLLLGVEPSLELHAALAELSRTHRQVKFYLFKSTVTAALDLVADPFVPDHLAAALAVMGRLCDESGKDLQHRFGGRTAFEEETPAAARRRRNRYN